MIPLMYEPGTAWRYGVNVDWVGLLVQRLSGLTLDEYFKKNIFARVDGGMPDTTFYPRADIKHRKAGIYKRDAQGELERLTGYGMDRPMDENQVSKTFHSGGLGLYGTTKDYLALLRAFLQCDPRNSTPPTHPLLSAESYLECFKPSVQTQAGRLGVATIATRDNYFSPPPTPETVNHSITMCLVLADSDHGRRAGTGTWSGAAKTHFWIDPTTGIAVSLCPEAS